MILYSLHCPGGRCKTEGSCQLSRLSLSLDQADSSPVVCMNVCMCYIMCECEQVCTCEVCVCECMCMVSMCVRACGG